MVFFVYLILTQQAMTRCNLNFKPHFQIALEAKTQRLLTYPKRGWRHGVSGPSNLLCVSGPHSPPHLGPCRAFHSAKALSACARCSSLVSLGPGVRFLKEVLKAERLVSLSSVPCRCFCARFFTRVQFIEPVMLLPFVVAR